MKRQGSWDCPRCGAGNIPGTLLCSACFYDRTPFLIMAGLLVESDRAPFVKVTHIAARSAECDGRTLIQPIVRHGTTGIMDIDEFLPDESAPGEDGYGPRGRFRIEVSFWPEDKP